MATKLSEIYQLARELQLKVAELSQTEGWRVYLDLDVHGVDDSQVTLDVYDYFTTTEYGTEVAGWRGNTSAPDDTVRVRIYGARGQRLQLPPDPTPELSPEQALEVEPVSVSAAGSAVDRLLTRINRQVEKRHQQTQGVA